MTPSQTTAITITCFFSIILAIALAYLFRRYNRNHAHAR